MSKTWFSLASIGALLAACGSPVATDSGTATGGTGGGIGPTGGAPGSGGAAASGGNTFATGGAPSGGGTPSSGGTPSTGGAPGSGGAPSTGGAPGAGGGMATIYSMACARCHGENAEGVADKGPAIVRATHEMLMYMVRFGDANETLNMTGGVVGHPQEMDAFTAEMLPDSEIAIIEEFLHSFPKPTTGEALFAENCAFCHGADAKGGETEYASAFHSAPYSTHDLNSFTTFVQAGNTSENGQPVDPSDRRNYMPPFEGVLTAAEIGLIYEWASAQ